MTRTFPEISFSQESAQRWAYVGVLSALAIVFGWVETFIPLPLPVVGIKLGFSNIAVLVALQVLDLRGAALVSFVKVLVSSILFGNPLMILFSAAGTLLAFVLMAALFRISGLHVAVVSVAGAMAHNVGQLCVAQVVLGTPLVWMSTPFMLVAACVTGTICGFAAKWTLDSIGSETPGKTPVSALVTAADSPTVSAPKSPSISLANLTLNQRAGSPSTGGIYMRLKLLALVVYFMVAFHANSPIFLTVIAGVAIAYALFKRLNFGRALKALKPLLFVLVFTVFMQLAYNQNGQVLAQLGGLAITDEGVWQAIRMVVVQLSVVVASVAFAKDVEIERLIGVFAWCMRPFERLGFDTRGLLVSLSVSVEFIPVFVREFNELRARGAGSYPQMLSTLVRSSFHHADALAASLASDN